MRDLLLSVVGAILFWIIIAVPVSVFSGLLVAWPPQCTFPWSEIAVASLGTALGIVIYCGLHVAGVRRRAPDQLRLETAPATVIGGGTSIALAASTVAVLAWITNRGTIDWHTAFVAGAGTSTGIVAFALLMLARSRGWIHRHSGVVWDRRTRKPLLISVALAIATGILFISLGHVSLWHPRVKESMLWHILDNPGGVFAFITGALTLAGVYLTVHSMAEFGKTITTFPELLRRLCDLIEHTKDHDYVRFLCYTPLPGCWAVPEYLSVRLRDLVHDSKHKLSVVTLDRTDLARWFGRFSGRFTTVGLIDEARVMEAADLAELAIKSLGDQADLHKSPKLRPIRLRSEQMPGYYLFANEERAIIVSPMFLPLPEGTNKQTQIAKLESVQVIGIETGDPGVVAWVNKIHDVYRDDVSKAQDFCVADSGELAQLVNLLTAAAGNVSTKFPLGTTSKFGYRLHVFRW